MGSPYGLGAGLLEGFGQQFAQQERTKLELELQQRAQLWNVHSQIATDPNTTPEARLHAHQNLASLASLPMNKPVAKQKQLTDLASAYPPPPGYNQQQPPSPGPQLSQTAPQIVPPAGAPPQQPGASLSGGGQPTPGMAGGGPSHGTALPAPPPGFGGPQYNQVPTGESEPLMGFGPQAAPAPPPYTPHLQYSPQELAEMAASSAGLKTELETRAKSEADLSTIREMRAHGASDIDIGLALGHPIPSGYETFQPKSRNVKGSDLPQGTLTITGDAPDPDAYYDIGSQQGQLRAMPAGIEATAAEQRMKFAASQTRLGEIVPYAASPTGYGRKIYNRDGSVDRIEPGAQAPESSASAGGITLSPEAIDMSARYYLTTAELPPMGLGSAGLRKQILDRAAQLQTEPGGSALAQNKASFDARQQGLVALQRNRSAVGAFESTALKNLDLFQGTAKKIIDSGSPWVNTPLRSVNAGALGSGDLAAFNAARNVALTEISRVLSSPNLTGVLSNEARQGVSELIGPNATLAQIYSAADILKQDMANRKSGLDDEISSIQGQLRGPGGAASPATQTTGHTVGDIVIQNGKRFRATAVDKNGKVTAADPA